jgi:hypothetical protein
MTQSSGAIYLTKEEQRAFAALPADVRGDWKVETEREEFKDTEEDRTLRFSAVKFSSSAMNAYKERAATLKTPEAFLELVGGVAQADIPTEDITQLLFAIGPVGISEIIDRLLAIVQGAADIRAIASLTKIRRSILPSL